MIGADHPVRDWNFSRHRRLGGQGYHPGMKPFLRKLLWMAGYAIAFHLALQVASLFWHPPAGLRFAAFLLSPPALWLPLMLTNELVEWLLDPSRWRLYFRGWGWFLCFFAGAATGPLLLRWRGLRRIDGPIPMGWLLGAMLLSAVGQSLANMAWPFSSPDGVADAAGMHNVQLFLQLVLGDYIGMLIVVPVVFMCVRQWRGAGLRFDRRMVLVLAASLFIAVLAGLSMGEVGYRTYIFVAALFLVPATYLAFRIGWQGAAVALTAISILIAASSWVGGHGYATMEGQLFIATAGSVLLILGAAVDALRRSQDQVLQQNMALADGNARLNELSSQMQETARRNLSVSEDLRRWMATELHDELGQNLTALQVRIRLAERHPDKPGTFAAVEEIIGSMRRSVTGLLAELRPAGLDEFGLVRALRNGPIAELVASAGLEYRVRMSGDAGALECLDDDAQTALYRIVQEAATNTVRHAHASWFDVRLRSRHVPGGIRVVLVCANDGVGMPAVRRLGAMGLHGMDDRVRSFGGRLRIRSDGRGVRILSDVTFPAVSVDGPSIA